MALTDIARTGRKRQATARGRAPLSTATAGSARSRSWWTRAPRFLAVGRQGPVLLPCSRGALAPSPCSPSNAGFGKFPRLARIIRRRSGSSAPSPTFMAQTDGRGGYQALLDLGFWGVAPARQGASAHRGLSLRVPAREGDLPDPGRPVHAGIIEPGIPLHRQWRDGGAARTAARLCA